MKDFNCKKDFYSYIKSVEFVDSDKVLITFSKVLKDRSFIFDERGLNVFLKFFDTHEFISLVYICGKEIKNENC